MRDLYQPWGGKFPHPELDKPKTPEPTPEAIARDTALFDFLSLDPAETKLQ